MENKENNYIWLFGDKNIKAPKDNSYYFWKHVVNKNDSIEKYIVFDKNKNTLKLYDQLSEYEKSHVLWSNSEEHYDIFVNADFYFVSSSYRDVFPKKLLKIHVANIKKPVIFLKNSIFETINAKLNADSYNNNIFRFCTYDSKFKEILKEKNYFKDYQLLDVKYPPKYAEFVSNDEKITEKNQILWNVTWRKYYRLNRQIINEVIKVLKSDEILRYLKDNDLILKLILPNSFNKRLFKELYECQNDSIVFVKYGQVDFMNELNKSKLFIDDYSPFGYDFTFLNRPVILFQPDLKDYYQKKSFYLDLSEMDEHNIESTEELIEKIVNEDYEVNALLKEKISMEYDPEEVKGKKYLDDLYDYLVNVQMNKITFIGFNFYGIGGTVNATKALSEGLLEKGYLVELFSMIKSKGGYVLPYGLNSTYGTTVTTWGRHSFNENLYNLLPFKHSYLKYDSNKTIKPFAARQLAEFLNDIRSRTVISTRESLHYFLRDCESNKLKNKLYFFHAPSSTIDIMYPKLINKLKKEKLEKAIFVTDNNRLDLYDLYSYDNYDSYVSVGNSIEESKMVDRDEIVGIEKKEIYRAIYLVRIAEDRKEDLDNLISFAKYLNENNINNIIIDVFGTGNYTTEFLELIQENKVSNIIIYRGKTDNPSEQIRAHDFMIDFTLNHSFGMIYIEGVFNGCKVFCMKNKGSLEVLGDVPNSFIESYEWLCEQISHIDEVSKEELQENYDIISRKYSRSAVADKVLSFLD